MSVRVDWSSVGRAASVYTIFHTACAFVGDVFVVPRRACGCIGWTLNRLRTTFYDNITNNRHPHNNFKKIEVILKRHQKLRLPKYLLMRIYAMRWNMRRSAEAAKELTRIFVKFCSRWVFYEAYPASQTFRHSLCAQFDRRRNQHAFIHGLNPPKQLWNVRH